MRRNAIGILVCLLCLLPARAHETPVQLPAPESTAEAWNVIEQSRENVNQLVRSDLMRDIGGQLVNISTALRALAEKSASDPKAEQIRQTASRLIAATPELLAASRDAADAQRKFRDGWSDWCKALAQLEGLYPTDTVHAQVYICPMHPMDRHLKSTDKCSICGMSLVPRHLPASSVYQKPGEQTLKFTVSAPRLIVGKPTNVLMRLSRADGTPVRMDDLLEMHTKKIHLLINDRSLSDYHHVHPEPTSTPGEYRFSFTPDRPGPYRVWADVVPASSGIQEYDIADLPADTTPLPISDRQTKFSSTVDGRRFDLAFQPNRQPLRADQTVIGTITITDRDGKPCTSLEPIMGAFAHLVGFSEDGKSVLHIHPAGKEPTSDADRAGPAFAFKFYAPAAGFLRLYCQVHINGRDVFAPFNLNIDAAGPREKIDHESTQRSEAATKTSWSTNRTNPHESKQPKDS